ncbi:ubiquitin-protein transferase activating protein [Ceratobasidium sp. 392]|nr:ubiquitin-protein transferase activating protein [Ceratobasidium sp. 392]
MPRRKRTAGDIDGRASSPPLERANEACLAPTSGLTPRKPKRTRIISPQSCTFPGNQLGDSASSPDEDPEQSQSDYSGEPLSTEQEFETEPESSIPPHIRRLIKGKQVQRHATSSSGFINMTSHLQPLPADSDTDESSFWSADDTSFSSTSSALFSDTSLNVQMNVVRFDWPGFTLSKRSEGRRLGLPRSESGSRNIHRVRSAPNLSPDRFIPRHSTEDDTLLHRSTKSTPRSVRLARHLGFVIGDGLPIASPAEKFEERLKQARKPLNTSPSKDPIDPNAGFAQRVMAAGATTTPEQTSAGSSTRLESHSTRSISFMQLTSAPVVRREHSSSRIAQQGAFSSSSQLRHSVSSESILDHTTSSRLFLIPPTSSHTSNPATLASSSISSSTARASLRQLPHEQAMLLRSASAFPHTSTIGASGAAMSLGMSIGGKTKATSGKPSPSSRYHMQRAPIHVYDAPEVLEVCAIGWNRNLLAAGLNGCALLWDMRCAPRLGGTEGQGGEAFKLGTHGGHKVCGVKWRDDGEMLATGGDDNIVCVWDVRMPRKPVLASDSDGTDENSRRNAMPIGQTPMWRQRRHTGAVKALAWCPWAPNILASGGGKQDGTVCFWNIQTGALKETLALGSQITSIAFSPVCREFVTTHGFRSTSSLSAVNSPNPTPSAPPRFQTYDPHPPSDNDPPTPPLQDTANSIVTHAYPSLARVAHVPNLHGMRISHASLSPDGSRLMTGGTFEALVMWSVWGAVGKEVDEGIGSAIGMIR